MTSVHNKFSYILRLFFAVLCLSGAFHIKTVYADAAQELRVAAWNRGGRFDYGADGSLRGYDADLVRKLSSYLDIPVVFVQVSGPGEAIQKLDSGELDLVTSMRRTDEREKNYLYSGLSSGYTYSGLITLSSRDDLTYEDTDAFQNCAIGYEGNSGSKEEVLDYLDNTCHASSRIPYDSIDKLRAALHQGDVDIMATGANNVREDEKIISRFAPEEVYFLTSKTNYHLMEQVDEFLTSVNINSPDYMSALQDTYFPMYATTEFTRREQNYIDTSPVINVGVPEDRCPISYIDPDTGEFAGIGVDLMKLVAEKSGLTFSYSTIPSGTSVTDALLDPTYDIVIPTVDESHYQGEQPLYISHSLMDMSVLVAVSNANKLNSSNSLKLGVAKELSGLAYYLGSKYPQHTVTAYDNQGQVLEALQAGQIDAIINNIYVLTYLLQNPHYSNLTISPSISISVPYCIAADKSRTDATLFDILDKSIYQITDSDLDSIIIKYNAGRLYQYTLPDYIQLNRQPILILTAVVLCGILAAMILHRQRNLYYKNVSDANAQLTKANNAKTDFLSRMSHDIRTPMNAIIGLATLGSQETADSHAAQYFQRILSSGDYLLGLINDILDMRHMETGEITFREEDASVQDMTTNTLEIIRPLLEARNMTLDFHQNHVEKYHMSCDPLRFQQVHINLLSNAIKFSEPGSKIEWNIIETQNQGGRLYVKEQIIDHGCGMSREFLDKIFLPFEQELNKYSYERPGTGLGLTICKSVMDQMGGKISVESVLGEGSTFTLEYSVKIVEAPEKEPTVANPLGTSPKSSQEPTAQNQANLQSINSSELHPEAADDTASAKASSKAASPYAALTGHRILMCEDHPINTEIAKKLLQKQNLIVDCAANGQIGVDLFLASPLNYYDIILMDIKMPVMDGLEATRQIRALDREDAKTIPIIALTANAYEQDRQNCFDAGMNEHIAKPINPMTLYGTLLKFVTV